MKNKKNYYLKSYSSLELLNENLKIFQLGELIKNRVEASKIKTVESLIKSIMGLFSLGVYELDNINEYTSNRYFQDSLSIDLLPLSDAIKTGIEENSNYLSGIAKEVNDSIEKYVIDKNLQACCLIFFDEKNGNNILDYYQGNNNKYISDFRNYYSLTNSDRFSHIEVEALANIHLVMVNILNLIAYYGLTGEISPAESLLTDESKRFFDKNGYMVIEGVLSDDEVDKIKDIIIELAQWEQKNEAAYFYGGTESLQRVYNLLNKHDVFRELIQKPIVLEIMEYIFDRETLHDKYVMCSWHSNIIGPGGPAQILHVDSAVPEPLPSWVVRANINYMITDFTEDNGATLCIPGSHLFLTKPKAEDQLREDLAPIIAPKGSLAVWSGHLWHKSGENKTNEERIALLGGFAASHLREMSVEEDHLRIINNEVIDGMTPVLKRLIGVGAGIKKGALQAPPKFGINK